jgi:hypothetical protein
MFYNCVGNKHGKFPVVVKFQYSQPRFSILVEIET